MVSVQGQVVFVSGSSRGVGLAIAQAFHREGAHVVLNYIHSRSESENIAAGLERCIAVQADVTDLAAVQSAFSIAESRFGKPVGVVVNSALATFKFNGDARAKIEDISWHDFDRQMRGSLQGALNTTKAALPGFARLGGGRIINIGSNLVQNPVVPYQDYTSAKGALHAFTHTAAAELGPKNITVNLVSGGLLRTTDASRETPEAVFKQIEAITPLRKVTTPEDLTGAVLFFASGWAQSITGQQLIVDGGLVMT